MLPFVLLLTAGGLIAAVCLIIFVCENVVAVIVAVLAARFALATGGSCIGALLSGLLAYAAVVVGLRFGVGLARAWPLRLGIAVWVVVPASLTAFVLADAIMTPIVPSMGWRILMAAVGAIAIATGAARKLVGS